MNELPELPKPFTFMHAAGSVYGMPVWAVEAMRSYALSAVQMERERCIKICEAQVDYGLSELLAAIRSPSKEG